MNDLEFLQNWYASQCNDDWEHQFGIKIETLDNPGWSIVINLEETEVEEIIFNNGSIISDNDWYYIDIKDKKLTAYGDINKLTYLLEQIKQILTESTQSTK